MNLWPSCVQRIDPLVQSHPVGRPRKIVREISLPDPYNAMACVRIFGGNEKNASSNEGL